MIRSDLAEKLKSISETLSFKSRDDHDIDSFHAQYEVTIIYLWSRVLVTSCCNKLIDSVVLWTILIIKKPPFKCNIIQPYHIVLTYHHNITPHSRRFDPCSLLQVKEELGRGLTSIVCKCVDRFTGEKYAVKIIDLNQSCDLDVVDSIVSEVGALSSLPEHPNITSFYKVTHRSLV